MVSFGDSLFKTVKDANQEISSRSKVNSYIDMLIKITLTEEDYNKLIEEEIDSYEALNTYAQEIEILRIRKGD